MDRRERGTAALIAVTLVISPLTLGSGPRWAVCVSAMLCLAAAAPLLWSRRQMVPLSRLSILLGLATLVTAIQLLPLPAILVEQISPTRAALTHDNTVAWGTGAPSMIALSYDPPATWVELARLAGLTGFAFACLRLTGSARWRTYLIQVIAMVGAGLALVALIHGAFQVRTLFGIYEPNFSPPRFLAPLLNPNHLGAYLAMAAPLAAIQILDTRGTSRLLWAGAALLCIGVGVVTESKGATVALALGLVVTGMLLWFQRRREQTGTTRLPLEVVVPAVIVVVCSLVLLVSFTAAGVADQFAATTTESLSDPAYKLSIWQHSVDLISDNPWTGVGRGGFESAFTRLQPVGTKTFSHVENEYLQAVIDWGLPAAIAMAVLLALVVVIASRRALKGPQEAAAAGALLALAAHNFVDFNLELSGVAVAAVALVATLMPPTLRHRPGSSRLRAWRTGALAAGAAAVVVAASPWARPAAADASRLEATLDEPAGSRPSAEMIQAAEAAMDRHPSDYATAGVSARILLRAGDQRAVAIMNRALQLNPHHWGLHLLAAQLLASTRDGKGQALVEYSLALTTCPEATAEMNCPDPRMILSDMLARLPDEKAIADGLPTDPRLCERIAEGLTLLGQADIALDHARRVRELEPLDPIVGSVVAELALRQGDPAGALEAAAPAYASLPDAKRALIYGRALLANGKHPDAVALLSGAVTRARSRGSRPELVALLTALAEAHLGANDLNAAMEALDQAAMVVATKVARAAAHRVRARVEDRLGNRNQAAWERRRAEQLDPSSPPEADGGPLGPDGGSTGTDAGSAPVP